MRAPLELYLYTCLYQEGATTYQLHTRYGLSYGAASPALERLREAGFITSAEPSKGDRAKPYSVNRKRLPEIAQELLAYLYRPVLKDIQSILRICAAALAIEDDDVPKALRLVQVDLVSALSAYLRRAISERKATVKANLEEASRLEQQHGRDAFRAYPWMGASSAAAVAKAEAAVLADIAGRLSPGKAKRGVKR